MAVEHGSAMTDVLKRGREEINKMDRNSKIRFLALPRGTIKHNNDIAKLQQKDKSTFDINKQHMK
eukprot:5838317-Ditylum_brightwellii.AAC.1